MSGAVVPSRCAQGLAVPSWLLGCAGPRASLASATVYRLNTVNTSLSGLTPGAHYWLGTAGGLINVPLDPQTDTGQLCQYLGRAASATELVTVEYAPVYL